jgi:uncharacterized protein
MLLLAVLALLGASTVARAEVPVPPLKARVTDLAGVLTGAQRSALAERLAALEQKKGSQIAVLIVPTTQPETIEQYGIRVADQWKLGRKGVDDGAILVVALKDRAVRIEVGYGLEGVLPDAIAKRIIDEEIVPRFRQGDFYGGIEAGVGRMIRVVEGEPLPPPRAKPAQRNEGIGLQQVFILALLFVFVVGGLLRAMFGRWLGSGILGAAGGFIAWALVGSFVAAIFIAIFMAFVSLVTGVGRYPSGRGGIYPGGWGGGWGSGGGGWSSGGGFSGGGGGFGGGGASGRW